jgi:uncharacterized membrane protein YqjE
MREATVEAGTMTNGQGEKTTVELMKDLSTQLTSLVHEEMELATAEISEKGERLALGAGLFGMVGAVLLLAAGALVAAAIAALSQIWSVWLAALVVGTALAGVAGVMAVVGRSNIRRGSPPIPQEAISSTKEDVQWLKAQTQSAKP